MEEFVFNKVTEDDLETYTKDANVFNMSEEDIKKEKVILTSFEDEKLGSSQETLDIAVYNDGKWSWLDIADKIAGYNEIHIGYVLEGIDYTRVLVLVRRMSSMILDTKHDGFSSYILCKIGKDFDLSSVSEDKALMGLLAKSHIFLDEDVDSVKQQIQTNIIDRNEEICSRLFTK